MSKKEPINSPLNDPHREKIQELIRIILLIFLILAIYKSVDFLLLQDLSTTKCPPYSQSDNKNIKEVEEKAILEFLKKIFPEEATLKLNVPYPDKINRGCVFITELTINSKVL